MSSETLLSSGLWGDVHTRTGFCLLPRVWFMRALFLVNPSHAGTQFESCRGKADSTSNNENYNIERQLQNASRLNSYCWKMPAINRIEKEVWYTTFFGQQKTQTQYPQYYSHDMIPLDVDIQSCWITPPKSCLKALKKLVNWPWVRIIL